MTENLSNVWYYLLKNASIAQKLSDYCDGRIHFVDYSIIRDMAEVIYPDNEEGQTHVSDRMEIALNNTDNDYIYIVEIEDVKPEDVNASLSVGDSILLPLNHPYPHNRRNRPDATLIIRNIHQRIGHRVFIAENANGAYLDYKDILVPLLAVEWIARL